MLSLVVGLLLVVGGGYVFIQWQENSFLLAMDRSNNQFLAMLMVEDSRNNDTATTISKSLIDYLETYSN